MIQAQTKLTLAEFFALPETDAPCELVGGAAIPKMSLKYFHSTLTTALWSLLSPYCAGKGRVVVEWAVILQRQGEEWVPVPDLLYISYDRLPADWQHDQACPVPPDLVIEIMSQGQTFKQLLEKAADYLNAGVDRVWLIDPTSRSISVLFGDRPPQTYTGADILSDPEFTDWQLSSDRLFQLAGI
jgi:Uma2 family endonuclease